MRNHSIMNATTQKLVSKEYVKMPPLAGNTSTSFGGGAVEFSPSTHKMLDNNQFILKNKMRSGISVTLSIYN